MSISSVKLPIIAAAAALLLSITPTYAQTTAYDATVQPGNQNFGGNLGMDFDVTKPIAITSLGAFDTNGDGWTAGTTVTVAIFDRNTQAQVGPSVTFALLNPGTLVNGDRFLAVTPFILAPGQYSVVAIGFNGNDLAGNSGCVGNAAPSCFGGNPFTLSTENGNGAVNFVGSGRFDNNPTLDFPTTADTGPSNRYLAGTFQFVAVQAPTIDKVFVPVTITVGQTTTLHFFVKNPVGNPALHNVSFSDTLPAGLVIATPNGLTGSCGGGAITAVAGTNLIKVTGATLPAGAASACTFSVNVLATGPESATTILTNTTSTVTSTEAPPGGPASDILVVIPADAALISYSANMRAGDSKINLTNAGTDGGNDKTDTICANVYVFAEDQQLIECCTCPLTPNHLRTLSVNNDLINNTLTPGVPIGITTMLVATAGPLCDAARSVDLNLVAGLRAWGTTLHAAPGGGFAVTETPFLKAALSLTELDKMTQFCGFIQANGSKYGICNSCQDGAAGAKKQ